MVLDRSVISTDIYHSYLQRNQLESHQKCILELEKIISNLKENPPKKSEKKNRLEFEESIRFREEEVIFMGCGCLCFGVW